MLPQKKKNECLSQRKALLALIFTNAPINVITYLPYFFLIPLSPLELNAKDTSVLT